MVSRFMEKYEIRYQNYIREGDSKTYPGIVKEAPYGKYVIIHKKECGGGR